MRLSAWRCLKQKQHQQLQKTKPSLCFVGTIKGLRLSEKCRCEGTYCYCFLSCINFVSYVDFPYWPLRHFWRFCCCNIRTSPASTTSCMHLVSISKFHPPRAIVSNKNHMQDNVSQFAGNLCELEGPRCLNRSTLGRGTFRVGLYGCNLHAAKCVKMSEAKTASTIAGDETVLVLRGNYKKACGSAISVDAKGHTAIVFLSNTSIVRGPVKDIEWSRKVFQLEHGAQLSVCDARRAPNWEES